MADKRLAVTREAGREGLAEIQVVIKRLVKRWLERGPGGAGSLGRPVARELQVDRGGRGGGTSGAVKR